MSTTCEELLPLLAARSVGALDAPARLEAHLATGCAACAALASDLEGALDGLRLPEEEPAPGGWDRVALRLDPPAAPAGPAPTVRLRCAYCRDDLHRPQAVHCAACVAPHHAECFAEHGRCAAPGCAETQVLRAAPLGPRRRRWLRPLLGLGLVASVGAAAWAGGREAELQRAREWAALEQRAEVPLFEGQPASHWVQLLGDLSPEAQGRAMTALRTLGTRTLEELRTALWDDNPTRRRNVVGLLGQIVSRSRGPGEGELAVTDDVYAEVGERLRADRDPGVRRAAGEAVLQLGRDGPRADQAAAWLGEALQDDEDVECRAAAACRLRELATAAAGQALVAGWAQGEPQPEVRRRIVEALALVEGPDADAALTEALRDADEAARSAAAAALSVRRLDRRQVEAVLLAAADPKVPLETILCRQEVPALLAALARLEGHPVEVQGAVLEAVARQPASPAGAAITEGLARYLPWAPTAGLKVRAGQLLLAFAPSTRSDVPELVATHTSAACVELLTARGEPFDPARVLQVLADLGPRAAAAGAALANALHDRSDFPDRARGLQVLRRVAPDAPETRRAARRLVDAEVSVAYQAAVLLTEHAAAADVPRLAGGLRRDGVDAAHRVVLLRAILTGLRRGTPQDVGSVRACLDDLVRAGPGTKEAELAAEALRLLQE